METLAKAFQLVSWPIFTALYFFCLCIVTTKEYWLLHIPLFAAGIGKLYFDCGHSADPLYCLITAVLCFVTLMSLVSKVPPIGRTRRDFMGNAHTDFSGWSFSKWWSKKWWS